MWSVPNLVHRLQARGILLGIFAQCCTRRRGRLEIVHGQVCLGHTKNTRLAFGGVNACLASEVTIREIPGQLVCRTTG